MKVLSNLLYSKSHEWVKFTDATTAVVGLTDFAQQSLGGLVFANLPTKGDTVAVGESFGDVESVKAVSDLYSPITGTVLEVNESVYDNPQEINESPYESWLIKVGSITDRDDLLSSEEYEAHCEEEE